MACSALLQISNCHVDKPGHLQTARHRVCGCPSLCPGQEAEEEAESGTQGLPGEGGLQPSPLGHGDGCAAGSLHSLSWRGTPHQPDHRVSRVCLHRNKCSAVRVQVLGTAFCTVRAYSKASILCSFSLCILNASNFQKQGMEMQSLSQEMMEGKIPQGPFPQTSYAFSSRIPPKPSPITRTFSGIFSAERKGFHKELSQAALVAGVSLIFGKTHLPFILLKRVRQFQLKFFDIYTHTHPPLRKISARGWHLAGSKQTKTTQK